MPVLTCEVCNETFYAGRGRPPRTCEVHRDVRLPKRADKQNDDFRKADIGDGIDHLPTDADTDTDNRMEWEKIADEKITERHNLIKQVGDNDAAKAIKTLLETLAPSIDEDQVRAIVNDAIGNRLSDEAITNAIRKAGVIRHELTINGDDVPLPAMHHHLFPSLIRLLTVGVPGKRLNVFLPGPAGSGKTTAVEQAAQTLGMEFASLSVGPTTPMSKFFGYMDANGNFVETTFYRRYKDGGVFLIDEIDNGDAGLLAELNQAIAGNTAAFACGMVAKHPEFRCAATGNTFGTGPDMQYVGRNKLDAATLDRFWIKEWPIDEAMETSAAMAFSTDDNADVIARYVTTVQAVRKAVNDNKLLIVVSPRATIDGAMGLSGGVPWDEVINERLVRGIAADTRRVLGV